MRKITLLMMAMAAMSALAGTCRWTGAGGATTIDFNGVHAISNLITTGTSIFRSRVSLFDADRVFMAKGTLLHFH